MRKSEFAGNNIPFVEAKNIGPKQRPTAIVLRTSFTTGDGGAALGVAKAWHTLNTRVDSCHYVIDEFFIFRCLSDRRQSMSAYTPRFNRNAITINVCHNPPFEPEPSIVHRTSVQVARLCRLHRIRPRLLDEDDQLRWIAHPWKHRGGIIVATVGDFPTTKFFNSVKENY